MKALLVQRGIPSDHIDVIYNWCDENTMECTQEDLQTTRKELGFDGYFNVVFAGTIGKMQALSSVLEAAELIMHDTTKVKITFIGGGIEVDQLKAKAVQLGLTNVQFLSRRPVSEIGKVLSAADALLVHLKDNPLFHVTIPSKIPTYLYTGRPIIAAVDGDSADLVIKAGAGLHCKPEDKQSIADAVLKMSKMDDSTLNQFGSNGHSFYNRELSFAAGVKQFDRIFRNVTGGSPDNANEVV
jgi:glycosyltransferase involved in cell wall biosynthesis